MERSSPPKKQRNQLGMGVTRLQLPEAREEETPKLTVGLLLHPKPREDVFRLRLLIFAHPSRGVLKCARESSFCFEESVATDRLTSACW